MIPKIWLRCYRKDKSLPLNKDFPFTKINFDDKHWNNAIRKDIVYWQNNVFLCKPVCFPHGWGSMCWVKSTVLLPSYLTNSNATNITHNLISQYIQRILNRCQKRGNKSNLLKMNQLSVMKDRSHSESHIFKSKKQVSRSFLFLNLCSSV